MPAGSERPGEATTALPHTWRPLGPRLAGVIFGSALVVSIGVLWVTFDEETRQAITPLQRGTVIALLSIGYAGMYALMRSRIQATEDHLTVVNGYRRRDLDWAEVVGVHLPPGAPWVTLDLSDGTSVAAMGIQGSDGARARTAARDLRALVDRPDAPRG